MVVGASHGGITVGEVESVHKDEVGWSTCIGYPTSKPLKHACTFFHLLASPHRSLKVTHILVACGVVTWQVVSLIRELKGACESKLGTTFQDGVEARLCAYTRSVAHFPTAVKELPWRNGGPQSHMNTCSPTP